MGIILIKEINQENNMKHIAAYALLLLAGKEAPTADDVEKVLKDAGVASDSEKAKALAEALKGKQFHELVKEGTAALGAMGTGSAAAAAPGAGADAAEEKADDKKKEEEEDEDIDMG